MTAPYTPTPAAEVPPPRRITVDIFESDNVTKVATLETDSGREWTDELNDVGSASLSVPLYVEGGAANPEADMLTRGRIAGFNLDGEPRFAASIRPRRQTSVAVRGHAALSRQVNCQGLLGEWARAKVPPPPGAFPFDVTTRHWGWMSLQNDLSHAASLSTITRPTFAPGHEHPEPWIDAFGGVVSGYRYWWYDYTPTEPLAMSMHLAFVQARAWLNSVPAGEGEPPPKSNWDDTRHFGARLAATTNRFAFDVQDLGGGDARLTATAYEINDPETGRMQGDTILFRTGYVTGTTPFPWKMSNDPGGMTVKQILRQFLAEVSADQGVLGDWTLDGPNDFIDANGNPLDRIADFPTTIGMGGDELLRALAAAHCDLAVSPPGAGKKLYVYRWRERGSFHLSPGVMPVFSDAIFAPVAGRTPNLSDLTHEERLP